MSDGLTRLLRVLHLDDGPAAATALAGPQWPRVLAAAAATGVMAALASVAVRAALVPDLVATDLPAIAAGRLVGDGSRRGGFSPQATLLVARARARERTADLLEQGRTILAAMSGLRVIPLKGLHLLLEDVWPDPPARSMSDLDLLVAPEDLLTARRILVELGYRLHEDPRRGRAHPYGWLPGDHHDPPVSLAGRPGTVELHRTLLSRAHRDAVPTAAVLDRVVDGRMTDEDLLAHLVAHAHLTDQGARLGRIPLQPALDVAYLLRHRPGLDPARVIDGYPHLARVLRLQLSDSARLGGPPVARGHPLRWRVAGRLVEHPRLHRAYRRVSSGHRSLAADRIAELYPGSALLPARVRHVWQYARRRVGRPPSGAPFDFADGIVCLNPDSHPAHWHDAMRRFTVLGIGDRVERLPAVSTPDNHGRAAACSWWAAIDLARGRGYHTVLVFADDAVFHDETIAVLGQAAADLRRHRWDLLYLGGAVWSQLFPFAAPSTVLQRCTGPVTGAPALAVHRRAYDRILAEIPPADEPGWLPGTAAVDGYFGREIAAGRMRAYITWPRLATRPALRQSGDLDLAPSDRFTI